MATDAADVQALIDKLDASLDIVNEWRADGLFEADRDDEVQADALALNVSAALSIIRQQQARITALEAERDAGPLAEREACATIADPIEHSWPLTDYEKQAYDIRTVTAAAIRARSNGAASAPVSDAVRGVPEGWRLVPVEPTLEMIMSARDDHEGAFYLPASLYRHMLAASPTPPQSETVTPPICIDYTNYRGERSLRNIRPIAWEYNANEWHPEPQWLLRAFDLEKGAERTFAWSGIHRSPPPHTASDDVVRLTENSVESIVKQRVNDRAVIERFKQGGE